MAVGASAEIIPRGGERFTRGQEVAISWDALGVGTSVNIDLWDGRARQWHPIASNLSNTSRTFLWIVPGGLAGDRFRIRVSAVIDAGRYAMSGTYFTILSAPGGADSAASGAAFGAHRLRVSLTPEIGAELARVTWDEGLPRRVELVGMSGQRLASVEQSELQAGFCELAVGHLPRGAYLVRALFEQGSVAMEKVILY